MTVTNRTKIIKILTAIIVLVCFCGIVYYVYDIVTWHAQTSENDEIKQKLNETIDYTSQTKNSKETKTIIDFTSIKNDNNDAVAYLKVNNTNIDYIVVQADDNDYYLSHNFEKKYNIAGWVFADYRNKLDESDKNIIIYGHNVRDGSMFGSLEKVLSQKWYENKDNYEVTFITENNSYKYQVFSVYSIVPEDYYISTDFSDENTFSSFVNVLKNRSIYDFGVDVTSNDKILTLSSCIGSGEKRVVLHAKLITSE